MADIDKLESNPKDQLWEYLSDVRLVMLGSPDPQQHMQPMTPQLDREHGLIWFFAPKASDLVEAIGTEAKSIHMCVVEKDYQACIRGNVAVDKNQEMIDRFWSPMVAAWFEGGKADPDMTMLSFTPQDGAVWASNRNPVTFAYEIARANLKDKTPDIGGRASVSF